MERLTNTAWRNFDPWECCGQDNFCTRGCHEKGGCNNGCIVPKLYGRLAAYEDTGIDPDELRIIGDIKRFKNEIIFGSKADRLKELSDADKDGRLVVLPCKVGDTIYVIGESCDFCETYLDEPERCMRCEKGHYVEERGFELWMLSELNESIFLTREEAEAAMKGGEG